MNVSSFLIQVLFQRVMLSFSNNLAPVCIRNRCVLIADFISIQETSRVSKTPRTQRKCLYVFVVTVFNRELRGTVLLCAHGTFDDRRYAPGTLTIGDTSRQDREQINAM